MSYPTVAEFKDILLTDTIDNIINRHIFEGNPYVFRNSPKDLDTLKNHLASKLPIMKPNIAVIGSAKLGFSLNPDTFFRQFSDDSDIDIAIVDDALFDKVWMAVLGWNYPRRLMTLGKLDGEWMRTRRKEIYWGWFVPDQITYEGLSFPHALMSVRDISTNWFNAFQSFSQYQEFSRRQISGRLYRTWDHAFRYHAEGLRLIKVAIQESTKGKIV